MARIHILPPDLADKIAAGEVVERPASVVKELVENALDAGADFIRVDIEKGGKQLIRVTDNGCGMTLEETQLAIQRHATSKIQTLEDLTSIKTLGFRGEALPSIASVSRLMMETKLCEPETLSGTYLEVHGGERLVTREAGCPAGTAIQVKELFYNTPARQKFLKSDGVEAGHIEEVFIQLALSHLECGFDFYQDGKQKLSLPVVKDPLLRLKNCLGNAFAEEAIALQEITPDFKLSGWIAHPKLSAHRAQGIYFYLNRRFLRDRVLQHALMEGYADFLMRGQYPKAVLYLELASGFDVNVHPMKREVRFVKPQWVHSFVAQAVKKALQERMYSTERKRERVGLEKTRSVLGWPPKRPLGAHPSGNNYNPQSEPAGFRDAFLDPLARASAPLTPSLAPSLSGGSFAQLKVLGSIAQTYILCGSSDRKLVLIDQHAAHERIGYEKLKKQIGARGSLSQRLLVPLTWETTPRQAAVLKEHLGFLREAGLEIEPFGGNTFLVKSAPTLIPEKNLLALLAEMLEELAELSGSGAMQNAMELVLKTMACHTQVRAGDPLAREEIEYLLKEMDEYHATHCPHGRPTTVEISLEQIEKWFKRT